MSHWKAGTEPKLEKKYHDELRVFENVLAGSSTDNYGPTINEVMYSDWPLQN